MSTNLKKLVEGGEAWYIPNVKRVYTNGDYIDLDYNTVKVINYGKSTTWNESYPYKAIPATKEQIEMLLKAREDAKVYDFAIPTNYENHYSIF